MSSLKRLKNEKKNFDKNIVDYIEFNFFPDNFDNSIGSSLKESLPQVYIVKNKKVIALFEIPSDYPFKPPIIYMQKLNENNLTKKENYINWSFRNGEIMKKEIKNHKITSYDLLNIWFFIINKNYLLFINKDIQNINDFKLNSPNLCFCCSTILCSNKWSPAIKIIDIVFELVIREELFKLCKKEGLRYIYTIFHNERWNLSEDIIWNILYFIIKE